MPRTNSRTASGVYYDLAKSPYVVERNGLSLVFSSVTHMDKFKREVLKKEAWLNDSLSQRFKCVMHVEKVADLQLYWQVETRGYRVYADGVLHTEPDVQVWLDLE